MYYIEHVAWAKSRKGLIQAPYCFGLKRFLCAKMHLRKMSSAFFNPQHACSTVRHYYELPSRERSHIPQKWHFESMIFRTSPGGICIHSLEGITTAIDGEAAGTKSTIDGEDFYGAYDAQDIGPKFFPVKLPGKTRK